MNTIANIFLRHGKIFSTDLPFTETNVNWLRPMTPAIIMNILASIRKIRNHKPFDLNIVNLFVFPDIVNGLSHILGHTSSVFQVTKNKQTVDRTV